MGRPRSASRRSWLVPLAGLLHGLLATLLGASLIGCAGLSSTRESDPAGSIVVAPIELGRASHPAHWYLPAEAPTALVVLEHGFLRHCENLRETTRRLMAAGLMVLCVEASMRGGNPGLAESLARALVDDRIAPPGGRAVPQRIVVAGHSAGALFAVRLGAALDALAPERLAGAMLVDPVDGREFEAGLRAISAAGRRPVLALLAPPHRCNARSRARPALERLEQTALEAGSSAVSLVLLDAEATHADVEGEDTSRIAEWSCGDVRPDETATLRELVEGWARRVTIGSAAVR